MHQENNKELDSFLLNPNIKCGVAHSISKYYTDGTECPASSSDGIREILKNLRNFKDHKVVLDDLTSTSAVLSFLLLMALAFPAFHKMYKYDGGSAVVGVCIFLFIAFWFAGVYGWATQIA